MDVLDQALARLAPCAPEFPPHHFSNHAPMVVEALVALGREPAVGPWLDGYHRRLVPAPAPGEPLEADAVGEALGRRSRYPDFCALIEAELSRDDPWAVLERWVRRLAPGAAAAAFHGLLRTAHAARALTRGDTQTRRGELARGLAYWAATYQPLADAPASPVARPASHAITDVPRVALDTRAGSITGRLAALVAGGGAGSLFVAAPGEDVEAFVGVW